MERKRAYTRSVYDIPYRSTSVRIRDSKLLIRAVETMTNDQNHNKMRPVSHKKIPSKFSQERGIFNLRRLLNY